VFPDALDFSGATTFSKTGVADSATHSPRRNPQLRLDRQTDRQTRSARAVGQALGKNPLLVVVPCHRVIAGDGTLGGFGCGLPAKKKLLKLEKNKKVRSLCRSFHQKIAVIFAGSFKPQSLIGMQMPRIYF